MELNALPAISGFFARHLPSGRQIEIRADQPMNTASVIKVPILVQAIRDSEAGQLDLDERRTITPDDLRRGSGLIQTFTTGIQPTFRDLNRQMITTSDNVGTDIILGRVGQQRVNALMQQLEGADPRQSHHGRIPARALRPRRPGQRQPVGPRDLRARRPGRLSRGAPRTPAPARPRPDLLARDDHRARGHSCSSRSGTGRSLPQRPRPRGGADDAEARGGQSPHRMRQALLLYLRPDTGSTPASWSGRDEHVPTGRARRFGSGKRLLDFLREVLAKARLGIELGAREDER